MSETEGRIMTPQPTPNHESEEKRIARAQIDQMKDTSGFNHNMEAKQDFLRLASRCPLSEEKFYKLIFFGRPLDSRFYKCY